MQVTCWLGIFLIVAFFSSVSHCNDQEIERFLQWSEEQGIKKYNIEIRELTKFPGQRGVFAASHIKVHRIQEYRLN